MIQPELRFKYFHKNWILQPFKGIVKRISKHIVKSGLPRISFDDINSGIGSLKKIDNNNKAGIYFKSGDVLFGKLRPYLKNWLLVHFDGIATGDFWVLRSKCNTFLYAFIQTEKYNYISNITSGTKMPRSDWKLVSNYKFNFPSLPEQQLIGKFFAKLDKLIQLQQKKVALLKKLKRGYLQKLFPRKGESIPRLRFKGFHEVWHKVFVKDLFKVTRGHVLSKSKISENKNALNKYPVYSSQTANNGLLGYYKKYLYKDAITWTTDGANAGTVRFHKGKFYSTNVNGVLLSNKGYDNEAVSDAINLVAFRYVSHVGNPKLMNNVMATIPIKITSLNEQKYISRLLEYLSNEIKFQMNKLSCLRKLKKAYLQKMFC